VDTELARRERFLQGEVSALVRLPPENTESYIRRFAMRGPGPAQTSTELLMKGEKELRYPPDSKLEMPEAHQTGREQQLAGLIVRQEGDKAKLYIWAFAAHGGNTAIAMQPVTHELLAGLVPKLGDVNYTPLMGHIETSNVPEPANLFDFSVSGIISYPSQFPNGNRPRLFTSCI
jgi:hypothetical protein